MAKKFTRYFLFLLILWSGFLGAQNGTGTVSGSIHGGKETLQGATVIIEGTSVGTTTDSSGKFELRNVPVGKKNLKITFIGFQPLVREVTVSAGKTTDAGKIILESDTKNLTEVTVNGQMKHGSENQAISMTRKSQRVITVVSSENIKRLPDQDAADALKRVAGVAIQNNKGEGGYVSLRGTPNDWSSTLINGDRLPVADEENTSRSFEFEVLPSNLIDYIDVTRTVTPDLEGDNIGGSINFVLKAPVDKRTFLIDVTGGYSVLPQKPVFGANVLWGDVSKNKKFRYVLNATYQGKYYAADAFTLIYGNNFNHAINRFELKDYSGMRNNFGFNGGFDWDIAPKCKISLHGMTGIMKDDKWQNKMAYTYASGDGTTAQPQYIHGILNRQLFGGDMGAEVKPTSKLTLNFKYSGYYNRFYYGNFPYKNDDPRNGYFTTVFTSSLVNFNYTDVVPILQNGKAVVPGQPADPNNPVWGASKLLDLDNPYGNGDHYTHIKPMPTVPISDSTQVFIKAFSETNSTYEADPVVAQFDGKYEISPNVTLQFGLKDRYKIGSRSLSYHWWTQDPNNGLNTAPYYLYQFQTRPNRWGSFLSEYGSPYKDLQVSNMTHAQLSTFLQDMATWGKVPLMDHYMNKYNEEYPYWVGSSYSYQEIQSGGYLMADAKIGKLSIVGGIRLEYTHLFEQALDLNYDTLIVGYDSTDHNYHAYHPPYETYTKLHYLAVLPALNLTYVINDRMNLRAAISRTFHRQNFQETKPGAALIKYSDFLYIKGNPNLKPTFSYNFDLSYQYFWGNKGMFTLSTYAKYIVNHIFVTSIGNYDPLTYFIQKSFENAGRSWVWGIEGEIKRKFDFLPGFLSGFGVGGNITYSISRMHVPGRPGSQAMSEQSPLLYNVSLLYEKYGVKAAIALNYNSPFLLELNLATLPNRPTGDLLHKNSDFDVFMGEQYSLDVQIGYEFKKHYSVYVEGSNLLDWAYKQYIGNPNRPLRVEYYKQSVKAGFKFEL